MEDGAVLDDPEIEEIQDEPAEPQAKRQKVGELMSSAEEIHNQTGLLNADTLDGLRYFAEIRKRHAVTSTAPPKSQSMGLGLAGYGSDED